MTSATPEQMTFGEDTEAAPPEPTPEELQAAELSRAAREAVRQPADPRIDRQLARMGLSAEDVVEADGPLRPGRLVPPEEVERIDAALGDAEKRLARLARQSNLLAWVVTFEGVAIALLALIVLVTR